MFVLINPYGGKRRASKIYEAEIKPLLEAAGVEVTMQGKVLRGFLKRDLLLLHSWLLRLF